MNKKMGKNFKKELLEFYYFQYIAVLLSFRPK